MRKITGKHDMFRLISSLFLMLPILCGDVFGQTFSLDPSQACRVPIDNYQFGIRGDCSATAFYELMCGCDVRVGGQQFSSKQKGIPVFPISTCPSANKWQVRVATNYATSGQACLDRWCSDGRIIISNKKYPQDPSCRGFLRTYNLSLCAKVEGGYTGTALPKDKVCVINSNSQCWGITPVPLYVRGKETYKPTDCSTFGPAHPLYNCVPKGGKNSLDCAPSNPKNTFTAPSCLSYPKPSFTNKVCIGGQVAHDLILPLSCVAVTGTTLVSSFTEGEMDPCERYLMMSGSAWATTTSAGGCLLTTGTGLSACGYSCGGAVSGIGMTLAAKGCLAVPPAIATYGCVQCYRQSPFNGYCPEEGFREYGDSCWEFTGNYLDYFEQIYGIDINFVDHCDAYNAKNSAYEEAVRIWKMRAFRGLDPGPYPTPEQFGFAPEW